MLNNPLAYTDPSGYSAWTKFRDKILKPVVAIVASYFTYNISSTWAVNAGLATEGGTMTGAIGGAAGGFVGGAINSGNLRGAASGAFGGMLFGAIGGHYGSLKGRDFWGWDGIASQGVAHGLAGGVMAELGGGKFGHGFAAAGVGFAGGAAGELGGLALEEQFVVATVAGGTASSLTGGKFANGALTSAFGFVFNQVPHRAAQKKTHKLHLIASKNAPVGHVAIAGEAPDGTVVARGFYPAQKSADVLTSDVAGVVKNDKRLYDAAVAGESSVAMQTLSVTQAQHDAALRFMNGFADTNQYNLYRCSCVTAALQSLNAAGVSAFNTGVFGAAPHAVYKAIDLGIQIPRP